MDKATRKAIGAIADAGFGYIKFELEAQLGRDEEGGYCDHCDEGNVECYQCEGSGAIDTGRTVGVNDEIVYEECDDCSGSGFTTCEECDGEGNTRNSDYSDVDDCARFILDSLSDEDRERLVYSQFYNDGSVDSEFTFTVKIEHLDTVERVIRAFTNLADEIGNGVDTDGAGMHITAIPTESNGRYPVYGFTMPSYKYNNFTAQVGKLLPTLYFLASADHRSRQLGFRQPQIDEEEKYSAIYTHDRTCFEYRIFETCYDEPTRIYDYVKVIANTLKYYSDPTATVPVLNKQFALSDSSSSVSRFFSEPEALRVLNAQVRYLKPSDKSYKQLKLERGLHCTIKSLEKERARKLKELRRDYENIERTNLQRLEEPLSRDEIERMQELTNYYGHSRETAMRAVRRLTDIGTFQEFVQRNLQRNNRYTLSV